MEKSQHKFIIGLVIGIIIGLIIYRNIHVIKTPEPSVPEDTLKYFTEQAQASVRDKVGQPIEGYEPFMFLQAYPGLKEQDFNGVQTILGVWEFKNNELVYRETSMQMHSAARAITQEGMQTLLDNVATRLNMQIETRADVDNLLDKISK